MLRQLLLQLELLLGGDGAFNMEIFGGAMSEVGEALRGAEGFRVVVGKSTVPQRTSEKVNEILGGKLSRTGLDWAYVSNPETLAEGSAVDDFRRPDRVIIGTDSDRAFEVMRRVYHPFVRQGGDGLIKRGSPADAELAKLGANTLLAMRVAAIDELARIADSTPGADMENIRLMVGADKRIGYQFLFPGPGYGGSCFPKDVQGLVAQAKMDGYNPELISMVHGSNEDHKGYMARRITSLLESRVPPTIAVWGVTFKPGTDDMRDAPSGPILTHLVNSGARVAAYDPQDRSARDVFGGKVDFKESPYEAVEGADALVLLTEWSEFHSPDYGRLKEAMGGNTLFDLRNRWRPVDANAAGFDYFGVGRNFPLER